MEEELVARRQPSGRPLGTAGNVQLAEDEAGGVEVVVADDDPIALSTALASFITFLPAALASEQDLTKLGLRLSLAGSGDQRSDPRSAPSPDLQRLDGHSESECEQSAKGFPAWPHFGQMCNPLGQRPPGPACGHLLAVFQLEQIGWLS